MAFRSELADPFLFPNPREFRAFHFPQQILSFKQFPNDQFSNATVLKSTFVMLR